MKMSWIAHDHNHINPNIQDSCHNLPLPRRVLWAWRVFHIFLAISFSKNQVWCHNSSGMALLDKVLTFSYAFIYEPPHDKTNKWHVHPAKTQISLDIRPVWSESLLCTQWVAKNPSFLHADSEDSDQTGRMPRLIWVFAGRTCHFVCFVMRRLTYRMLITKIFIKWSKSVISWTLNMKSNINEFRLPQDNS